MKKILPLLLVLLTSIAIQAHDEIPNETVLATSSYESKVLPRFFNDKIIVETKSIPEGTNAQLHIYNGAGKVVLTQRFTVVDEYVYFTNILEKGSYVYYIVIDNIPVAKGSFIKG